MHAGVASTDEVGAEVPPTTAGSSAPIEEIETPGVTAEADENAKQIKMQLEAAREAKARGNTHFKAGEYDSAIECYTQAIDAAVRGQLGEGTCALVWAWFHLKRRSGRPSGRT